MDIEDMIATAIANPGQFWGWLVNLPKTEIVGISCSNDNNTFQRFIREQFNLDAEIVLNQVSVLLETGEIVEHPFPRWLQWFMDDHDKVPQIQRINADMALFLLEKAVHTDRATPEYGVKEKPHYAVANHHHSFSYLEGGQSIMPFHDGHTYRTLKDALIQAENCIQEGYTTEEVKIYRLVEIPANLGNRHFNSDD